MATASLVPSRLPPPSASVSPLFCYRSCYLLSPLFTGVWRNIIKNAKHFEILGTSMKEDLERVQPWKRKEIPACPLQLTSCQAGAWGLITPIKFACTATTITGGGSDPTTLFTLYGVWLTVFAEAKKIVTKFTDWPPILACQDISTEVLPLWVESC